MSDSDLRQSSITVAVRVRPFTEHELRRVEDDQRTRGSIRIGDTQLQLVPSVEPVETDIDLNAGTLHSASRRRAVPAKIRNIVECVDDKMLIFDPQHSGALATIDKNAQSARRGNSRGERSKPGGRRNGEVKFVFDKLFDMTSDQETVYHATTRPLLDAILEGFNGTVFAYGATGCGKTYTISGTPESPGLIFQTINELFERFESLSASKEFELSLSYLEIYNETIRDLLNPSMPSKKLVIQEEEDEDTTPVKRVVNNNRIKVANLSHHYPISIQDVMDLIVEGNHNRTTSPTEANEVSSRSHAVLQIHITQTDKSMDIIETKIMSTLSIIDLAGSERAISTKNRGQRLYEGANINRSLLALGNCINALCLDSYKKCHVPYRDSKLTRLLKFSLGGNCKTVMIVCISPSSSHYDETLNTLKYANRAKDIKTKVIRNKRSIGKHVGSYLKLIAQQRQEIEDLKRHEKRTITTKLNTYKTSRLKIHKAIDDTINNVNDLYTNLEKFKVLKLMKSLILCKRRYLQLIDLELGDVVAYLNLHANEYSTVDIVTENCHEIHLQILSKIEELEAKFDSTDELHLIVNNTKMTDLVKLQELEHWDDTFDSLMLDSRLTTIMEQVKNDIMVNASILMERLFEDRRLVSKFKLLNEYVIKGRDLSQMVSDLVKVDAEFEDFSQAIISELLDQQREDELGTANGSLSRSPMHVGDGRYAPSEHETPVPQHIDHAQRVAVNAPEVNSTILMDSNQSISMLGSPLLVSEAQSQEFPDTPTSVRRTRTRPSTLIEQPLSRI